MHAVLCGYVRGYKLRSVCWHIILAMQSEIYSRGIIMNVLILTKLKSQRILDQQMAIATKKKTADMHS